MGWFDRNSWKRRGKLNDLRAELSKAEDEGKFIKEDGLYFAELRDMGNETLMVFAGSNTLASQEETFVNNFFDRNGFTVDTIKISSDGLSLDKVEIIPHDELIRYVGRALKTNGYRLIDDSDKAIDAKLSESIVPLSTLVRAITGLFSERVESVIKQTRIKDNKEGNRLLHWLPKIAAASFDKVPTDAVDLIRPLFNDAYAGLYSTTHVFGETKQPETTPSPSVVAAPQQQITKEDYSEMSKRITAMLVRSTPNQCISNSTNILKEINSFLNATASALLMRPLNSQGLAIFAQAGNKELAWGKGNLHPNAVPIAESLILKCVSTKSLAINERNDLSNSMIANNISSALAMPITVNGELCGILYIDRRGASKPFSGTETAIIGRIVKEIFEEFSDYTLGTR